MWVPFNEGWGQFDTARITRSGQAIDPTRLVDSASGWTDRGVGDVNDMHDYPGPGAPNDRRRTRQRPRRIRRPGPARRRPHLAERKELGLPQLHQLRELTDAYLNLIDKLHPLIGDPGLSAAIYTQTTDVEVEVNGLMTYDRAEIKMPLEKIAPGKPAND